jgi:hypothetical protein
MPLKRPEAATFEAQELNPGESLPSSRELNHTSDEQELPLTAAVIEEAEILHASIRAGSIAQIVIAGISVIGLLYLLKLVMVTTLVAILLAFVLEPLVGWFGRIRFPRPVGALIAVTLLVCLAGNLTFFFYNRAVGFAIQLHNIRKRYGTVLRIFARRRPRSKRARVQSWPLPRPVKSHYRLRSKRLRAYPG